MLRPYSRLLTRQDLRLNSATEGFPLRLHIAYERLTAQSITCQEQICSENTCDPANYKPWRNAYMQGSYLMRELTSYQKPKPLLLPVFCSCTCLVSTVQVKLHSCAATGHEPQASGSD